MRVFVQYLTSGEHERFIASIERERELRFRLSELLRYRSLGLTTQEEIIHYEQHASFENQQQLKMKTVSNYIYYSNLYYLRSCLICFIIQKEYKCVFIAINVNILKKS